MEENIVAPEVAEAAQAGGQQEAVPAADQVEQPAAEEQEQKQEPTAEQKRIKYLERQNRVALRQRAEARARLEMYETGQVPLPKSRAADTNDAPAQESRSVTLSESELQAMVEERARKLVPTIRKQEDEGQRFNRVYEKLEGELGRERFAELSNDLDTALDGLKGPGDKPKAAVQAIFKVPDPRGLIEFLTDPENAEEAEAFGRMDGFDAGMKAAEIMHKLAAKAKVHPERSNAPAPIEKVRGGGPKTGAPDFRDTKAWIKWRNEQEAKGLD